MKVGIVTIVSYNYGNRLQNYALQEVLHKHGAEVVTIRNIVGLESRFTPVGVIKRNIYGVLGKFSISPKVQDGYKKFCFERFNKRYISNILMAGKSLTDISNEGFDIVIVGSDQVWNLDYAGELEYLHFVPPQKRAMYAVSFGTSNFTQEHRKKIKSELQNWKYLSVREKDVSDILSEELSKAVNVHIDPTLLLTKDEWRKIEQKPKISIPKRYVLSYFLGTDEDNSNKVKSYCQKCGYDIIEIGQFAKGKASVIDPCHFVWLISHAQMVVTDSFHGTVFSIIMERPFWVFKRKEKEKKESMLARIYTLLRKLNISDRLVEELPQDGFASPDWSKVQVALLEEQKKTDYYLSNLLNESGGEI